MDTIIVMCYYIKHETPRYRCGFGETTAPRHSSLGIGPNIPLGSCHSWSLSEFSCEMAPIISNRGKRGASPEDNTWTPSTAVSTRQGEDCRHFGKRALGGGLHDKSMDTAACGRGNRAGVWYPIHVKQSVEIDACSWMELSEAREESPRARRWSDSALEALSVATYKKRLIGWVLTWYSLMRAGFPCSPMLPARGRLEVRRLCCVLLGTGQKFLRYLLLVFPLGASALLSTQPFIPGRISGLPRWPNFSAILLDISGNTSFFSGIEVGCIGQVLSGSFCTGILEFTCIIFLLMLLSLILMSLFGRNSKGPCQMLSPMTWEISVGFFAIHSGGCAVHNVFYGLAYEHLNYRGLNLVPIT